MDQPIDPSGGVGVTAFPAAPMDESELLAEINALRGGDHRFVDGTVYNSICTDPLPISRKIFTENLETNLGDNRLFPSLHRVERSVTSMLGSLLGCPNAGGGLVSGGTEANLLAVLTALERHSRRTSLPRSEQVILAPASAHYSFDKISRLLGVHLKRTRLDSCYRADPQDLARQISDQTAVIIATAGSSETGAIDDVRSLAGVAAQYGIHCHVDAATGGFLIPFLPPSKRRPFDFRVRGVASITIDPHKYGFAAIPAGWLLFREEQDAELLACKSHYSGTFDQFTLLGTRPGGAALSVYACLRALGRAGYQREVRELWGKRTHLLRALAARGCALAFPPDLLIVGVKSTDPEATVNALEQRGLIASVSRRFGFLRLVVQRHLSIANLDAAADALSAIQFEVVKRSCA